MLSTLLLLASCAAWVHSTSRYERIQYLGGRDMFSVGYAGGNFTIEKATLRASLPANSFGSDRDFSGWQRISSKGVFLSPTSLKHVVFEYRGIKPTDNDFIYRDYDFLITPIWFVNILLAVLPMWWLLVFRKRGHRYRVKRGLCGACGYNMKASAASCPECGAQAATSVESVI